MMMMRMMMMMDDDESMMMVMIRGIPRVLGRGGGLGSGSPRQLKGGSGGMCPLMLRKF